MARRPLFRFSASRLCAFSGFAASFRTSTFPSLRRYAVVFDPVRPEPANSEPDNSNLATAPDKSQYRFLLPAGDAEEAGVYNFFGMVVCLLGVCRLFQNVHPSLRVTPSFSTPNRHGATFVFLSRRYLRPSRTAPVRHAPVARFAPPPGSAGKRPFSRVLHVRVRLRSRRRGFARLIARASQAAGHTSPVCSIGCFSRRRQAKRRPDTACS